MGAAELIAELAFVGVPEHDQVRSFARLKRARIGVPEQVRRVDGGCGDGFSRGDSKIPDREGDAHWHREARCGTGVGVGCDDQ